MATKTPSANETSGDEENLEQLELLIKEEEDKKSQQPSEPAVTRQSLFFFLLLVGQSICNQIFFKLSQRGGEYKYNTMSAMVVVEAVKLSITLSQLMLDKGNVEACITTFKGVNKRVYLAYILLAISYAAYNQTVFYVMKLVDPGTFSLFKCLGPGVVALLNFIAYQKKLSQAQVMCIVIQMFGIVPVTASPNSETGKVQFVYGVKSIFIMTGIIFFGSFNTVYNASVVKNESGNYPMSVQNSILYSLGCFFNLLFYFVSRKPGDASFFYGYGNVNVGVLLFLHSTAGITVSIVYKYGDAVLKTLAQPVVLATLLFLSKVLFDTPLDLIKISAAGTVIVSTMLYMKLPPPPPENNASTESQKGHSSLSCSESQESVISQIFKSNVKRWGLVLVLVFVLINNLHITESKVER